MVEKQGKKVIAIKHCRDRREISLSSKKKGINNSNIADIKIRTEPKLSIQFQAAIRRNLCD